MIRPLADRIVVAPIEVPLSTMLEVVRFKDANNTRGEVIAIGPKANWGVQPGDVIHFTDAFKFPVILDQGEKRLILQEADVCFIEDRESEAA